MDGWIGGVGGLCLVSGALFLANFCAGWDWTGPIRDTVFVFLNLKACAVSLLACTPRNHS